jgi:hypothetical protein
MNHFVECRTTCAEDDHFSPYFFLNRPTRSSVSKIACLPVRGIYAYSESYTGSSCRGINVLSIVKRAELHELALADGKQHIVRTQLRVEEIRQCFDSSHALESGMGQYPEVGFEFVYRFRQRQNIGLILDENA